MSKTWWNKATHCHANIDKNGSLIIVAAGSKPRPQPLRPGVGPQALCLRLEKKRQCLAMSQESAQHSAMPREYEDTASSLHPLTDLCHSQIAALKQTCHLDIGLPKAASLRLSPNPQNEGRWTVDTARLPPNGGAC